MLRSRLAQPVIRRAFLVGASCALCVALAAGLARTAPATPAVPASRDGADRVGTKLTPDAFTRWVAPEKGAADARPPAAGSVTLYRWWTDTCP